MKIVENRKYFSGKVAQKNTPDEREREGREGVAKAKAARDLTGEGVRGGEERSHGIRR